MIQILHMPRKFRRIRHHSDLISIKMNSAFRNLKHAVISEAVGHNPMKRNFFHDHGIDDVNDIDA